MRQWIKEHLPKPQIFTEKLANYPRLRARLSDPNLWKLSRRPVARAVAAGLFINFIPIPFQLIMAVIAAVICRANLPLTVLLTLINNPFTFVPINYFIYRFGKWILARDFYGNGFTHFTWHLETLQSAWMSFKIWLPLFGKAYFLGLFILAFGSAIIGYFLADLCWRIDVYRRLWIRKRPKKI